MLKRRGLTELIKLKKVGAFRAERMVKVLPIELTGKNGCIQKKWVLLELIEL